jgi:hypothetical protein
MNGRKTWLLALAFAAAVVIGIILVVMGDGSPAPRPEAGKAEAGAAAAPVAPASPLPGSPGAAGAAQPTGPAAPAPSGPREWKHVRLAVRESDLGPGLARDVYDGLRKARQAMDGCFKAAARAEAKRAEAARGSSAAPQGDELGPPILTLHLEGAEGALVVVAAPLQQLGGGTTELVDCCEGVLRGYPIPAKAAVPGARYRLQYELVF